MFDWRKNVKTLFQGGAINTGFHHCKLLTCCKQSVESAQNPSFNFIEFRAEVIKQLHHYAMANAHLSGCVGIRFFSRSTKSIRRFWQSHENLYKTTYSWQYSFYKGCNQVKLARIVHLLILIKSILSVTLLLSLLLASA